MIVGNRSTRLLLGVMTLGLSAQAEAQRDLGSVLAEIDQGFVCPQFRPDDSARRADMLAFSRAIASVGPKKVRYREAAYIHAKMLERHNCTGGSGAMASVEAPSAGDTATPPASPAGGVPN